jgi:hypothetical protein
MAANASRHSLTIENTGNANCGINPTGGTASIGGAGTLTLAPLGLHAAHPDAERRDRDLHGGSADLCRRELT